MSGDGGKWTGALLGGAYRVGGLLGRGGMGVVYEATQESLGRKVAVKILHAHLAEDPKLVDRFRREAEAAAALGHPNIVQVTDFQHRAGEPVFLVMEYLAGLSLGLAISNEKTLAAGRVAFIAGQVLSALHAAHSAGIIHRDLKPDNIFLTSIAGVGDIVKLLDFGIAKLQDAAGGGQMTTTGTVMGTPAFMAPEQARGDEVDARADLYSVGAVAYQALTGKLPFEAANYNALIVATLEKTPTPLRTLKDDIPAPLAAVVERAMAKRREDRFQSATEMQQAFAPFAQASVGALALQFAAATQPRRDDTNPLAATEIQRGDTKFGVAVPTPGLKSIPVRARWRGWWSGAAVLAAGIAVASLYATRSSDEGPTMESRVASAASREEGALGRAVAPSSPAQRSPSPLWAPPAEGPSLHAVQAPAAGVQRAGLEVKVPASLPKERLDHDAIGEGTEPPVAKRPRFRPRAPRKLMSGKKPYFSGTSTNGTYEVAYVRAKVEAERHRVVRCFERWQFEPPDHQFPRFRIVLAGDGSVRSIGVPGSDVLAPRFERCMHEILKSIAWGKPDTEGGGNLDVWFTARRPDNP